MKLEDLHPRLDWEGECFVCDGVVKKGQPTITFVQGAVFGLISKELGFHADCIPAMCTMLTTRQKDALALVVPCVHPKSKVHPNGLHHHAGQLGQHAQVFKCDGCGKMLIGKSWTSCDC